MLNILIVDDNAGKIVEIKNAICQIASGYKINFSEASNIANACGLCTKTYFDLVILDLNIALFEKGTIKKAGGVEFLRNMEANPKIHAPTRLLGLTAYREIADEVQMEFAKRAYTIAVYSKSSVDWQVPLRAMINQLSATQKVKSSGFDRFFMIAIFILLMVVIFFPINLYGWSRILIYFMCALLLTLLCGKEATSIFKVKTACFQCLSYGAPAVVFIAMFLFVHLQVSEAQFAIYEFYDLNKKPISISSVNVINHDSISVKAYNAIDKCFIVFDPSIRSVELEIIAPSNERYSRKISLAPQKHSKLLLSPEHLQ